MDIPRTFLLSLSKSDYCVKDKLKPKGGFLVTLNYSCNFSILLASTERGVARGLRAFLNFTSISELSTKNEQAFVDFHKAKR